MQRASCVRPHGLSALFVTVAAVLLALAVGVGSAQADTTVGQTGTPSDFVPTDIEAVQTDAAMPAAGVVTSFQTQSPAGCGVHGIFHFQVLRPLGGGQFRVLGVTGGQDPCDGQLHSYPVHIPVRAGDVLGVYVVNVWEGLLPFSTGSFSFSAPIAEPAVGDTVTLTNSGSRHLTSPPRW